MQWAVLEYKQHKFILVKYTVKQSIDLLELSGRIETGNIFMIYVIW